MASIKEIIELCKNGQVHEGYDLAITDLATRPTDVWEQRKVAWALNYLIKLDSDTANFNSLLCHLNELKELDLLDTTQDHILYDNILFRVAGYIKANLLTLGLEASSKLSTLFEHLRVYNFQPSRGYSYLLQCFIKCDAWQGLADFIDWWDLDKMLPEDYEPFKLQNGKSIMALAEQVYIAQSKALLKMNSRERVTEFLPKLDALITKCPDMTYPGYFYGKLLLSLGSTVNEELRVILPFARRKINEFWVWQLLSDVFVNDKTKQLACLLRAVNCRTQEKFLKNVRLKLANLYVEMNRFDLAKFQVDKVIRCYLSEGWRLPYEVEILMRMSEIDLAVARDECPVDYQSITDSIILQGTQESLAVVVHYDSNSKKTTLIYGYEKPITKKLKIRVSVGDVLKINYIEENDGKMSILSIKTASMSSNLEYAKIVNGAIRKKDDKDFAFLTTSSGDIFIPPALISKHKIKNADNLKCLAVYDFNRRNQVWNWCCVDVKK